MLYISSKNGSRIFHFYMKVPYQKANFQYVYDWPWPTFKVTIGHWPKFALCFISQVIMDLGPSDFAWMFPTSNKVSVYVGLTLAYFQSQYRSLTKFHIMLYISRNNKARAFQFCMAKVWCMCDWPWPTFKVAMG
jgi:flavin-dependent dehydrogenase